MLLAVHTPASTSCLSRVRSGARRMPELVHCPACLTKAVWSKPGTLVTTEKALNCFQGLLCRPGLRLQHFGAHAGVAAALQGLGLQHAGAARRPGRTINGLLEELLGTRMGAAEARGAVGLKMQVRSCHPVSRVWLCMQATCTPAAGSRRCAA